MFSLRDLYNFFLVVHVILKFKSQSYKLHKNLDFLSILSNLLNSLSTIFPNMVTWHIKLKGMVSRTGYKLSFHPRFELVTLGWGKKVKYHIISLRAWGFKMASHGLRILVYFKFGFKY